MEVSQCQCQVERPRGERLSFAFMRLSSVGRRGVHTFGVRALCGSSDRDVCEKCARYLKHNQDLSTDITQSLSKS